VSIRTVNELLRGREVRDAVAEWKLISGELSRAYGNEPDAISLKQVLSLGQSVAELADDHIL
jgi:hypothetical protein